VEPDLERRRFIVRAGAAVAGLALGLVPAIGASCAPAAARTPAGRDPDPWLTIRADGSAHLVVPFTELGQGTLLGITQIVAEELDLPVAAFTTATAAMESRFLLKEEFYTGGSGSIAPLFDDWRRLGATARALLVATAAARWGVAADRCSTAAGAVLHPDGRQRLGYGALATAARDRSLPDVVTLKDRSDWRVIGQPLPRPDVRALCDGSTRYGLDTRVDGQHVAALAQCPVFGGRLRHVDPAPVLALAGVHDVVPLASAVAVVGDTFWHASRGLAALTPEWDDAGNGSLDSAAFESQMKSALRQANLRAIPADRTVDATALAARAEAALAAAAARVERSYSGPFISHATLEPQNAIAVVRSDSAELWVPTQHQTAVQREVAAALGLPVARVTVHTTRIGGGFGRRLKADYAVQAALVARAVRGPVQLVWSRGEDLQHDHYRPACVSTLTAGVDADGMPTALRVRAAALNDNIVDQVHGPWYDLDPVLVESANLKASVPVGAWRSVDASLTCFFLESFVDELAERAGIDPLAYRLRLAAERPRTRRALEAVAERTGWHRPGTRALGVAVFSGWGTVVAQIAEVERDPRGQPRVRRITCAFDCGTIVNPALVRAQVEGGITMGVSAALRERITIRAGRVEQRNFDDYRLLAIAEAPAIDVILLESPAEPVGGVGEPPVPAVAPAVANALFRLTGQRLRDLPLAAS
jgi:isoquinoline 1-oxidoreductase beta subunit